MRPLRFLATLCVLTSCGIPTTGVVEAGGPASGVVPTIDVYFVVNGELISAPRQIGAPIDVEEALRALLIGPNDAERSKQLTTELPLLTSMPTPDPPVAASLAPQRRPRPDVLTVTEEDTAISVELASAGELSDLGAAQIICTATAARRIADPAAEPPQVTVVGHAGPTVRCP
ncbi:putative secreted protein [Streptomyces davaonensis JCM 4913]|uniref:Putative secreted protein n=1 Tax=Streptomyces davaonensis (strain DSM 101723 / JCM 4913 / KCC S-0913 / 768) TaxID=1214101 RepID=K4QYJ8_STRDJ|nr:putative secreted protein [Streptomyces davaonensis]CCK25900.1 putative secreted protein [Streptomyces davaonensis JCM 4913]